MELNDCADMTPRVFSPFFWPSGLVLVFGTQGLAGMSLNPPGVFFFECFGVFQSTLLTHGRLNPAINGGCGSSILCLGCLGTLVRIPLLACFYSFVFLPETT